MAPLLQFMGMADPSGCFTEEGSLDLQAERLLCFQEVVL